MGFAPPPRGGFAFLAAPGSAHARTVLSLRFKREKFWYGVKPVPKLLAVAVYADSGALFERRVALGSAREAAFGPSG
jgi:hypothetical protein